VAGFLTWCDDQSVPSVAAVQPLHVAAWIEPPIASKHRVQWHAARKGDEVLGRRGGNHPDDSGSGEYFRNDPWSGDSNMFHETSPAITV
jgi:hypothetical protein